MEEIVKTVSEKISSYNIFNNLLPGIVFCYLLNKTTRFSIVGENILENVFIYYFTGMVISRIGSLCIEELLKKIKVKKKEPFLKRATYIDYIKASSVDACIGTLSETNNTYRTAVSLFCLLIVVNLFDSLMYDFVKMHINAELRIIIAFVALMLLFVMSYRKQTKLISERVEAHKINNQE